MNIEIPADDLFIWVAYNYRCVAHPLQYAVCLHEEPPKSKNPVWKDEPLSRYPVCQKCHEMVHSMSRVDAMYYLNHNRELNFHDAIFKIEEELKKSRP